MEPSWYADGVADGCARGRADRAADDESGGDQPAVAEELPAGARHCVRLGAQA